MIIKKLELHNFGVYAGEMCIRDSNNRTIMGSFDRQVAIKNDYIHFYAPGDEIFDCIVKNAMDSYKGMCTALAAESSINWKGFIYTYSIEPNERLLLDAGTVSYTHL